MRFTRSTIYSFAPHLFLLCCLIPCLAGAQILSDDFNGNSINPSLWQVQTPFSDSSMTESGGFAIFQNRGMLLTASPLPTTLDITGAFEFTGSIHDSFQIVLQTNGYTTRPGYEPNIGVDFGFSIEGDPDNPNGNIWIQDFNYQNGDTDLDRGTFPMSLDTLYNFRITESGTDFALYIGDLTTPFLRGTDSATSGDLMELFNRSGAGGGSAISAGSVTQLDYITVVPEPTTYDALAGMGFVGMIVAHRVRQRKQKTFNPI